jgi:hypothetical protein
MLNLLRALCIALATLPAAAGPALAGDLVYASSHAYSPTDQPPRYWEVGVTAKPPPKGVRPAYTVGKPDGRLAGWARQDGELILGFDTEKGLRNVEGPDLFVWHFGPGGTRIYVSTQPNVPADWQLIGDLPPTDQHEVEKSAIDFGKLDRVFFVKFEKWEAGLWGKGRFIDAVAGISE